MYFQYFQAYYNGQAGPRRGTDEWWPKDGKEVLFEVPTGSVIVSASVCCHRGRLFLSTLLNIWEAPLKKVPVKLQLIVLRLQHFKTPTLLDSPEGSEAI